MLSHLNRGVADLIYQPLDVVRLQLVQIQGDKTEYDYFKTLYYLNLKNRIQVVVLLMMSRDGKTSRPITVSVPNSCLVVRTNVRPRLDKDYEQLGDELRESVIPGLKINTVTLICVLSASYQLLILFDLFYPEIK